MARCVVLRARRASARDWSEEERAFVEGSIVIGRRVNVSGASIVEKQEGEKGRKM